MTSVFARPNKFNLSHPNLITCEMGDLVPFLTQEVLPGDEFRIKTDAQIRLAPMLAPIYGEVDFYTHYFFVPNRLIWDNWEDFITNGLATGSSSAVKPYVISPSGNANFKPGCLTDYMDYLVEDGMGTGGATVADPYNVRQDALPLRAYAKIYNDWYLSEFIGTPAALSTADGLDSTTNLSLLKRCWPRDYMTSALPFVQLGSPVTLPAGADNAPVYLDSPATGLLDSTTIAMGTKQQARVYQNDYNSSVAGVNLVDKDNKLLTVSGSTVWAANLKADLSSAQAVTVNDMRTAFQLQRILERKARSGNRYVEYLASAFGVRSADARLQRAEFLGGGKAPVMISEVLQTSAGTATSPQGNMSGHGFGASRSFSVNKAFTEHGYIIGILSVMPKALYFQGRPRSLARWSWTDYYQPEFAHLGEQPLFKSELLGNATTAGSDTFAEGAVFGYQPRYEEYRRKVGSVHGDFRSNMAFWHVARAFTSAPALNADFISCNPSKRIFAAGDQADRPCWIEMFLHISAIRPLPKKGTPGLIDH